MQGLIRVFADGSRETFRPGKVLHRGGIAGRIVSIVGDSDSVAKLYHNERIATGYSAKLKAMLMRPPELPPITRDGRRYVQIAWPTSLVVDSEDRVFGFAMPKVALKDAVQVELLLHRVSRAAASISENYHLRVFAARNLAAIVAELHRLGHHVIDMKPINMSVYRRVMLIAILDCDGFSIQDDYGRRYPAENYSSGYIAPEASNLPPNELGEDQDRFALAVIIFQLLNMGIHPFQGIPSSSLHVPSSLQERIAQRLYAYGTTPNLHQKPHKRSIHAWFEDDTLDLFQRAFTLTADRPTSADWRNHLDRMAKDGIMLKCNRKPKKHAHFSKGCGLCALERQKTSPPRPRRRQAQQRRPKPKQIQTPAKSPRPRRAPAKPTVPAWPPPRLPAPTTYRTNLGYAPSTAEALVALALGIRNTLSFPKNKAQFRGISYGYWGLVAFSYVASLFFQSDFFKLTTAVATFVTGLYLVARQGQTTHYALRVGAATQGAVLCWLLWDIVLPLFGFVLSPVIVVTLSLFAVALADSFFEIAEKRNFAIAPAIAWSLAYPLIVFIVVTIGANFYASAATVPDRKTTNALPTVSVETQQPGITTSPLRIKTELRDIFAVSDQDRRIAALENLQRQHPTNFDVETALGLELLKKANQLPLLQQQAELEKLQRRFSQNRDVQRAVKQAMKNPFSN